MQEKREAVAWIKCTLRPMAACRSRHSNRQNTLAFTLMYTTRRGSSFLGIQAAQAKSNITYADNMNLHVWMVVATLLHVLRIG